MLEKCTINNNNNKNNNQKKEVVEISIRELGPCRTI